MLMIKIIGYGVIVATLVFTVYLVRGISKLEREIDCSDEGKKKACEKCASSVGMINVVGNILMIIIKAYLGIVGNSKGLIADAIHSGADLLATIVMIIGLKISDKNTDKNYPYGYGKAEYIVAILIYLFLLVIAAYIIYEGILCIVQGRIVVVCWAAFWGAVFAIVINELMFRQSVCAGTKINSPSMVAKAWESRSDVYASIAVLIGVLGARMGFHFMDPLAAIVVGIIIIRMCVEMIYEAVKNLLDKSPDASIINDIQQALSKVENILGIKNIFARELGRHMEFDLEINVASDMLVDEGEKLKNKVKNVVLEIIDKKSIVNVRLYSV